MKKITLLLLCALCAIAVQAAGSGIYLLGTDSDWSAKSDWEFQTTDAEGVYILENKTVSGFFKIGDAGYSTYNYGSSGGTIAYGTTYTLASGSNPSDIDLGDAKLKCSKIVLAIANGNATLRFDAEEGVETTGVYVKVDGTEITEYSAIRIWAWNPSDDSENYTGGVYDKRPYMTLMTGADGSKYFYTNIPTTNKFKCCFTYNTSNRTNDLECDGNTAFQFRSVTDVETIAVPTIANPTVTFYSGKTSTWSETAFTYDADNDCYTYQVTDLSELSTDFLVKIDGVTYSTSKYINGTIKPGDAYKALSTSTYGNDMAITNVENFISATVYVAKVYGVWTMKIVPNGNKSVYLSGAGSGTVPFVYDADNLCHYYKIDDAYLLSNPFLVQVGVRTDFEYMIADDYKSSEIKTGDTYKTLQKTHTSTTQMSVTNTADFVSATLYVKYADNAWQMLIDPVAFTFAEGGDASWNGKTFTCKSHDDLLYAYHATANIDAFYNNGFVLKLGDTTLSADAQLTVADDESKSEYTLLKSDTTGKTTIHSYVEEGDEESDDLDDYDELFIYLKRMNGNWYIKVLASETTSGVNNVDAAGVKISANAGEIVVEGAQKVAVYTVGGALVSTDARTKVARGLYIVRADNQVKKVIVK